MNASDLKCRRLLLLLRLEHVLYRFDIITHYDDRLASIAEHYLIFFLIYSNKSNWMFSTVEKNQISNNQTMYGVRYFEWIRRILWQLKLVLFSSQKICCNFMFLSWILTILKCENNIKKRSHTNVTKKKISFRKHGKRASLFCFSMAFERTVRFNTHTTMCFEHVHVQTQGRGFNYYTQHIISYVALN